MTPLRLVLMSLLAPVLLASAQDPPVPPAPTKPAMDFSQRYGVLAERNIFLRQRRTARPAQATEAAPAAVVLPTQQWVLVGVVMDDQQQRAFLEPVSGGELRKLTVGDTLAEGQITAVNLDTIVFRDSGGARTIRVGQDLSGGAASLRSSGASQPGPGASGASPSTPAAAGGSDAGLSAEERMRRRRQQELNP
jgi:hypothetical protein